MSDNIQTNTTGRLTSCLQKKIDNTTYLVQAHFSVTSTHRVKDKILLTIEEAAYSNIGLKTIYHQ